MKTFLLFGALLGSSTLQAHVDEAVLLAFEKACMSCHDTYDKNTKAPPLIAVNQVYLRHYDGNMTIAMKHMESFLTLPNKKSTLMKPAVELFGVMPKRTLTQEERRDFAQVLIETEFEMPEWFDEHYKSHQLESPAKP